VYARCLAEIIHPAIMCLSKRNAGKHQHSRSHKVIIMASQCFLKIPFSSTHFISCHLHRSLLSRISEILDLNIGQETGNPN
jgi:hypothetical protein